MSKKGSKQKDSKSNNWSYYAPNELESNGFKFELAFITVDGDKCPIPYYIPISANKESWLLDELRAKKKELKGKILLK